MTVFHSPAGELPHIPDDLTIPQFFFDATHPTRPQRREGTPWLIEDATGRAAGRDELQERTTGLASALWTKYGIRDSDVVLIFSRNHIDYPVALWATHRIGGIISGANPDFTIDELVYQIQATNASVVITNPEALSTALSAAHIAGIRTNRVIVFDVGKPNHAQPTVSALIKEGLEGGSTFVERRLKPGEAKTKIALLSFSSGTTGRPKAVAIPHFAVIANVIQLSVHNKVNDESMSWEDRRYRPGDISIGVLPLYHIYGLVVNLHFFLYAGMSFVVVPKFNFLEMLNSIVRHRITHLPLVPPQAVLLVKHPAVKDYDLSCVHVIMCGAAPLTGEVNQQLFQLFPRAHIGQAYGMTETCTVISHWPIDQQRGVPGSAGQLVPGAAAKVVKTDGSLAGVNEPGEMVLRTASSALCYYNNEEATKETFRDGWIYTGDEVLINENSEIFVIDRLKEIMKVRGFQVAPAELEGCLLDHPEISDACVVGIPDDYSGEVPLAFIVVKPETYKRVLDDASFAAQIKASIKKHVANNKIYYKQLAGGVEFVDIIPKTPSGKILRRMLRQRAKELVTTRAKL